jgi:hypothetical protein
MLKDLDTVADVAQQATSTPVPMATLAEQIFRLGKAARGADVDALEIYKLSAPKGGLQSCRDHADSAKAADPEEIPIAAISRTVRTTFRIKGFRSRETLSCITPWASRLLPTFQFPTR